MNLFFLSERERIYRKEFQVSVISRSDSGLNLSVFSLVNSRQVLCAPVLERPCCLEPSIQRTVLSSCLWWLTQRHHLSVGIGEVMWSCEQMAQVKPWLCRSCPLNATNHLLLVIKISLTRVISQAFWQMWLAGCDMTQHYFLPPCAFSLEASSPLLAPISPMPRLAF